MRKIKKQLVLYFMQWAIESRHTLCTQDLLFIHQNNKKVFKKLQVLTYIVNLGGEINDVEIHLL